MKRSIAVVLAALALIGQDAWADIAFDTATTVQGDGVTELVVNHESTGDDLLMIVCIGYDAGDTSYPVTAVTYNGASLFVMDEEEGSEQGEQAFAMVNPDVGDHPVTVMFNAAAKVVVGIRTYTGVNQDTPIGVAACNIATGNTASVTVVTDEDNSWIVGCISWEGSGIITPGGSQVERYQDTVTGGGPGSRTTLLGDDLSTTVAGTFEMSYGYTIPNQAIVGACELIRSNGGEETPTPTRTATATPSPGPKQILQARDHRGPVYVCAPDTISLVRFENNAWDETGNVTWTNYGSVPYATDPHLENLYCVGEFDSAVDNTRRFESPSIPATVRTVEFWLYTDWDVIGANQFCYGIYALQAHLNVGTPGIDFACYGGWSAAYALADDTWNHIGLTSDQVDIKMFVNNAERASVADNQVIANLPHVIGNYKSGSAAYACDCWIDFVRLSGVVRTNFPTSE